MRAFVEGSGRPLKATNSCRYARQCRSGLCRQPSGRAAAGRDFFVHDIGAVAGRTGQHSRLGIAGTDRLLVAYGVHGLFQAIEFTDIEIHPAGASLFVLRRYQNDSA